MALVDAYARVSDLQQQLVSLAPAAPAPAPAAEPFSTALDAAAQTRPAAAAAQAPSAQVAPAQVAPAQVAPAPLAPAQPPVADAAAPAAPLPAPAPGCRRAASTVESVAPAPAAPADPASARLLAAAQTQVGQAEEPPGSNDSPAIARYRDAVAGAVAGAPWCAYFVSWAAAQAGVPLGEEGQGFGAVADVTAWAQRTGRLLAPGAAPAPGDLMLFGDRHMGIVESVNADGSLTTVEGNHRDRVDRVQRSPSEATGFVRI